MRYDRLLMTCGLVLAGMIGPAQTRADDLTATDRQLMNHAQTDLLSPQERKMFDDWVNEPESYKFERYKDFLHEVPVRSQMTVEYKHVVESAASAPAPVIPAENVKFTATLAKAQTGDTAAQLDVGWMYDRGQGATQDHESAFGWWLKAAEKGNADAENNVGACYFSGAGAPRDYQKAAEWYRKSADQGCTAAQAELGWMYFTGKGVARDKDIARQWWAKSSDDSAKAKLGLHVLADTKRLTPEGDNAIYGCIMGISPDGTFPDQILYIGDDGIICSKLKLADASKSLQEEYGYSPERAAAYRAERAAKQRTDAETRLTEMEGELRRLTALRRQRQIDDLNDNLRDLTQTLAQGPNARPAPRTVRDLHSVQDLDEAIYNLQESIDRMTEEPLKK